MSLVAIPTSLPAKRRIPWALTLLITCGLVAAASVADLVTQRVDALRRRDSSTPLSLWTWTSSLIRMATLQALNNVEIVSQVEGQNTILSVAKEGDFVHKGDVICKLDSSDIENRVESAQLDLQRAEADLTAAKDAKEIQESTNSANLEAANVDLVLAKLDLEEYTAGTYPSDLQDAVTAVEMAKIEVKNKEDDLDQTRSLFGKGFVTAVDVKTAEVALLKAKNDLDHQTTAEDVLKKYTHEKEATDRKNKVAQSEKKLVHVQRENASNLSQKVADLLAKSETLGIRKRQLGHLQEQLAYCTIKAPQDGMVVYSSSAGGSWGRRDTPIQPGRRCAWQEPIIRLPDVTKMKAVCRINKAQVSNLRVDPKHPLRATVDVVGQPSINTGWLSSISIMADSSNRFWNPDSKEYPVDVTLDQTPKGLKPGVSANVKIYVDRLHNVLAVPVSAVYAAGNDSYVFIRGDSDPKPVKIAVGQVNETHVQVAGGVSEGQQVLILQAGQGRELLEKAGIKVESRPSTTQPFDGKAHASRERASRPRDNGTGVSRAPISGSRDTSLAKTAPRRKRPLPRHQPLPRQFARVDTTRCDNSRAGMKVFARDALLVLRLTRDSCRATAYCVLSLDGRSSK